MPRPQKTICETYQERLQRLEERCNDVAARYNLPKLWSAGTFPYIPLEHIFIECVRARTSPECVIETYARALAEERDKESRPLREKFPATPPSTDLSLRILENRETIFRAALYSTVQSPNL